MGSTAPPELKQISPWLARASELKSADPVMSYWCTYHAAQLGMSAKPSQPGSTAFLFSLLDQLEAMRKTLDGNDAVSDEAAGSAYVENFALKVFAGADAEDRAGKASRSTATRFLAAVNFLELMSNFGALDEETQAKIKYARWKAADIGKALREGRTPVPGPVGGLEGAASPLELDGSAAEASEVEKQLLGLTANGRTDGPGQPDLAKAPSPAAPSAPLEPSFGEPSFGDPEPGPSGPQPPVSSTSAFPTLPSASGSAPALPLPPRAVGPRSQPPSSAFPSAVLPSAPTVLPSAPPISAPVPAPSAVPIFAPAQTSSVTEVVDSIKIGEAQKHARWAISALNFDDLPTARKELQTALSLIGE